MSAAAVAVDEKAAAGAADVKVAAAAVAAAGGDAKAAGEVDAKTFAANKSTVVVVTGATGFIASHIVQQLLARGYTVRGTATSLKADKLRHITSLPGAAERLQMFEANLNAAGSFDAVVSGSHVVLHTASPYSMTVADAKRDLLDPAVNGTLTVLQSVVKANKTAAAAAAAPAAAAAADGKAAAAAPPAVRRVVLTSSVAAITDSPESDHTYTEADWNKLSTLTRNPYYFSKRMAEEEAWKFAKANALDLVVINPFVVLGPSLSAVENPSVEIVKNLLSKKFPAVLDLWWGFVDVRDVARSHVLAFEHPHAEGRHLCCAVTMKMADAIAKLQVIAPDHKHNLPTSSLDCAAGTVLAKLGSYAEKGQVGEYVRTNIARKLNINNTKIRAAPAKEKGAPGGGLGLVFTEIDVTLRDTYHDLLQWGHLQWLADVKLSDAELDAAAAALKAAVPIADHTHGLLSHTHAASFRGTEAVDAILKAQKWYSRSRAVKLGAELLRTKRLYAKHDAAFADAKDSFFSFNAPK